MRIIVSGATGFLGTALCDELLKCGHEVIALIRPETTKSEKMEKFKTFKEKFSVLEISLDEIDRLPELLGSSNNVFYHLAWNGSSGIAREDFSIQYSNIAYTARAVIAARKCGCSKFVGAGSQAEYGVIRGTAKEDESLPHPFMMYGAAKLAAYHMGRIVAEQIGISFVWPRIYSVYGVGENPGTLISYVIESLRRGEFPILSACENMWDYIYITDCIKALCLLGERKDSEGVYHVSGGNSKVLKEYVEEIRDIISPGSELGFGGRMSDPDRTFWLEPDVNKLQKLGMKCEVTFKEGIKKMVGEINE